MTPTRLREIKWQYPGGKLFLVLHSRSVCAHSQRWHSPGQAIHSMDLIPITIARLILLRRKKRHPLYLIASTVIAMGLSIGASFAADLRRRSWTPQILITTRR